MELTPSLLLGWLVFCTIGALFCLVFIEDSLSSTPKEIEDYRHIYLEDLHKYLLSTGIGTYFKINKLKSPLYKENYVIAVRNAVKELELDILALQNYRREKINKFKNINPYKLTIEYISSLSLSERFFLVKALEKKAKEEKGEEVMQSALKVAGAVGLVALWIGTGGGL